MTKAMIVMLAAASFAVPAHANLVTNGGFETGNFNGWTQTGNTTSTGVALTFGVFTPSQGSFFAAFGPVGSPGGISQTLATTAGGAYTLSFDLANPQGGTPSSYSVSVDGNVLDSLTNPATFGYSTRSFSFIATSAATVLAFNFRHDPVYFTLDNVIVDAAEVPEPAMLGLFGLGAIGLGLSRRRKA